MELDTRKIAYFRTLIDCGGYRKAAAKLGITQPALSLAMQRLEVQVGAPILDRTAREPIATAFGEALYRVGGELLRDTERLASEISDLKGLAAGKVTLGVGSSVPAPHLARALEAARATRPDMRIRLIAGVYFELMPMLKSGEIDLMIGRLPGSNEVVDINHRLLFTDHMAVLAGPGHPLAGEPSVALAELGDWPWLFSPRWTETVPELARLPAAFGVEELTPAIDIADKDTVRALLRSGPYLSLWPSRCFEADVEAGILTRLKVPALHLPVETGIAWRRAKPLSPAAGHLSKHLRLAMG